MARRSHPKPEIEAAPQYAEQNQWRIEVGGSHAWGKMYCPYNDKDCRCGTASIWSTPKNPGNHTKQIQRIVDNGSRHNPLSKPSHAEE
ncbi:hypothetical protein [Acaryochloris sp. CCMEE 5410]|uniref:hypothetical protein n=1 Tax=Acaryochloris sp. CCMEE 5410 TaxID=310037 RepID=UPI0002484998|nr:hypothetical protein [Acaryochloris sp. CCMEE 5410]KAI9134184.1 hypothetical protein ON05_013435 [Acaryochloris sp. CCMEE 5410]